MLAPFLLNLNQFLRIFTMATKIRLARGGTKKRPYYRIVVADSRAPRDGRFIEKIGTYNPLIKAGDENRVAIDTERAEYWLSQGAVPTDRVLLFLNDKKIGQATTQVKELTERRNKIITLKSAAIAAKKAEAEAKRKAEEAEKAAAEAEAAAAATEAAQ